MSTSQYDWAKNIPCRNIQIHGFCKFEHKGCSYNHDAAVQKLASSAPETSTVTGQTSSESQTLNPPKSPASAISTPLALSSSNSSKIPIFKPSNLLNKSPKGIDNSAPLSTTTNISSPVLSGKKFNVDSPAFTPTPLNKTFSPSLDSIPTFIPNANISIDNINTIPTETDNHANGTDPNNAHSTSPNSAFTDLASSLRSSLGKTESFSVINAPSFTPNISSPFQSKQSSQQLSSLMGLSQHPSSQLQSHSQQPVLPPPTEEEMFYQNTNLYPVNFLLYAPPPPPHVELNKKPNERTVDDLFINNKLREYLQLKNEESLKSISNNELDLPLHVGPYHSLYPIDHNYDYNTKSFGYVSSIYKCMSNTDGKLYAMRRLQNVPITSPSVLKSVKQWKKLNCANCVKIYDVFTTRAFNDNSLILIYDYYPMSLTLIENHFLSFPGKNPDLITEDSLWNYTIQLLNAITEINKLNLSIGSIDPSKVIITNKGRIRLSALSINDILKDLELKKTRDNAKSTNNFIPDQDTTISSESDASTKNDSDLLNLGKLILFLAKSSNFIKNQSSDPFEIISQLKFTNVFKKMLGYLFNEDATIEKFQELVAPMILKLTNGLQNSCDQMESTLMGELENARLVRLFAKLDFVSERPEKDGSWSETGERYPIKLFKDYVFHQVDDSGKPVVDLTHVIDCLNKLDAGVEENILLVSPDEITCLIMSYKDLKDLVNKSFLKLLGKE